MFQSNGFSISVSSELILKFQVTSYIYILYSFILFPFLSPFFLYVIIHIIIATINLQSTSKYFFTLWIWKL